MAVSPLDFPFFDLTLPDLDFFDLPSLLSESFTGCCGGESGTDCGWVAGLLAVVANGDVLNCEFALLTTTSVRWSSSVCSFAKLTNTYNKESDITFFLFTTNLITFEPCQQDTAAFWLSTEALSTQVWNLQQLQPSSSSSPHLVQGGLGNREVGDAQLLVVVGQRIKDTSQAAGVRGQLVLQNVLMSLFQLDARKRTLHVGADGTGVWAGVTLPQAEDDGVAVSKPTRWSSDKNKQ